MDIESIKKLWVPARNNKDAGISWWNGRAGHFSSLEPPTAEKNLGMRIILRENMVQGGSRTLDVGCGGGRYSFAFEQMGAEAVATDFSPEMIRRAAEAGERSGSKVSFSVDDWHTLSLNEKGWHKSFDLVLANMTPAIDSADTFFKLADASRNWVLMVKTTRRTDSVFDELRQLAGPERCAGISDEALAYAFDLAWLTGGKPRLDYEDEVWELDMPLEKAVEIYSLRIEAMCALSKDTKTVVRSHLEKLADGSGNVHETTKTTLAAIYWQQG